MYKNTREIGFAIEKQARRYLEQQGLKFITANFSCKHGEIDLIMLDKNNYHVFIEVRARNNQSHGSGLESIDRRKRTKIVRTADFYQLTHGIYHKVPVRFDVVATTTDIHGKIAINWIKNAFFADE